MSQTAATETSGNPTGRCLGAMDAAGLGWRLLVSDFWNLWLIGLVFTLVLMGASFLGLPAMLVALPPLMAGLFWTVFKRIDGGRVTVGDLFAGFKERFGQSVIAMLPVMLASVAYGLLIAGIILTAMAGGGLIAAAANGDEGVMVAVFVMGGGLLLMFLAVSQVVLLLFNLLFLLVPAAVWDHPVSGWDAARASMRLAREHFLSVLGLALLFWAINIAANLLGLVTCCIGSFFTGPAVLIWHAAALCYLYRSWTGRPLVQPQGREAPAPDVCSPSPGA